MIPTRTPSECERLEPTFANHLSLLLGDLNHVEELCGNSTFARFKFEPFQVCRQIIGRYFNFFSSTRSLASTVSTHFSSTFPILSKERFRYTPTSNVSRKRTEISGRRRR